MRLASKLTQFVLARIGTFDDLAFQDAMKHLCFLVCWRVVLLGNPDDDFAERSARQRFMRADGDGNRVKYYEVELENVLVASMQQLVSGGSILHDSIGLRFSRVKWKYTQQKIAGGSGGNTAGGWDLATSRIF